MSDQELRQRRYIIAHTESSNGWGGQEIRILTEMIAMRKRGHQLFLCAPMDSVIYRKAAAADFAIHPLDDRKLRFPQAIGAAAQFFRQRKVEVVNTHSSRDGWIGGLAARVARTPLLLRSRHVEVDYPRRFVSRFAFGGLPDHVLTTSERISRRLIDELSLDAARVTCVPTGVDLQRFDPDLRGGLHDELGLSQDIQIVGMVSVLRTWKGYPHFLAAARDVARARADVHFVIAGEGEGRKRIELFQKEFGLEKRLTLLGYREDIPNVLASLSILVLPSTAHEGIPQIILQAQAMRKPVVATSIGGIPEVVSEGEAGFLVPPGNSAALAEKISVLLGDPLLRQQMGERARKRMERANSMDTMCAELERIYRLYLKPDRSVPT